MLDDDKIHVVVKINYNDNISQNPHVCDSKYIFKESNHYLGCSSGAVLLNYEKTKRTRAHIYKYKCMNTRAHTDTHTKTYTQTHTKTHTHIHTHVHIRTHAKTYKHTINARKQHTHTYRHSYALIFIYSMKYLLCFLSLQFENVY